MSDTPLNPNERYHLLQFVIATLRGLALVRFHVRDPAPFDPHLARLRGLVAAALRDGTIERPSDVRDRPASLDPGRASAIFV